MTVGVWLLKRHLTIPVADRAPKILPETWVRVVRVGGVRSNQATDAAMLMFECWAPNEIAGEELAGMVSDILTESPGGFVTWPSGAGEDRAWISWCEEAAGPTSHADPDYSGKARWTVTVQLGIATN